jgi:RNA polymerase sigma factor (sigma-70 family)
MTDHDDEALLERCRQGDREAAKQLLARHSRFIVRFFRTKVGPDEVADLAQETSARLLNALPGIRQGKALPAFVRSVARYVLCEFYRSLDHTRGFDPNVDSVNDLRQNPANLAIGRNEIRLLLAALRRLPLDRQIMLEQHYFEGVSLVELAKERGITDSTMRTHMANARGHLEREIARLEASGPLLASTVENLDQWASEIREYNQTHE